MTAETPFIVRASSLSSYADCPRRAACKSWPKLIEDAGYTINQLPSGIGAAVGTATHTGAAYTLLEKMANGGLGNAIEAEQRALDDLENRIREEGVLWDDTTSNLNTAQQQTRRMVRAYRAFTAPHLQPIAVEERLQATFAPGWVLSGQADVFEGDVLRDTKTGTARRANGAQYGGYTCLRRTPREGFPTGQPVNGIVEDYIRRVSVKRDQPSPEQHTYPVEAAEQLAWAVMNRIRTDVDQFRSTGDLWAFMPNPMSQMCSAKYCPAHGTKTCRAHRGL